MTVYVNQAAACLALFFPTYAAGVAISDWLVRRETRKHKEPPS